MERAIHGPSAAYNDIAAWNWTALTAALGAWDALVLTARTAAELDDALTQATRHQDRLVFIEAVTGKESCIQLAGRTAEDRHSVVIAVCYVVPARRYVRVVQPGA
jgi:indolepyruvate decarboxylase